MKENIDVQGHRGARGHLPENTLPSFLKAISMGVHTLEMDVVISKDHQVVISHEPFMNHEIATDPNGNEILESDEKEHNLYKMTLNEIKAYDVGQKLHPRFPDQEKMSISKPALSELFTSVEKSFPGKIKYNIELKRDPKADNIYHPDASVFVDLVVECLKKYGVTDQCNLQCFDLEVLQYIRKKYPKIKIALLIENKTTFRKNISNLGFKPEIYSPHYRLISTDLVEYCQEQKIKLIPWTVNEIDDIEWCIDKGVDGIISDFPDRVFDVLKKKNS